MLWIKSMKNKFIDQDYWSKQQSFAVWLIVHHRVDGKKKKIERNMLITYYKVKENIKREHNDIRYERIEVWYLLNCVVGSF